MRFTKLLILTSAVGLLLISWRCSDIKHVEPRPYCQDKSGIQFVNLTKNSLLVSIENDYPDTLPINVTRCDSLFLFPTVPVNNKIYPVIDSFQAADLGCDDLIECTSFRSYTGPFNLKAILTPGLINPSGIAYLFIYDTSLIQSKTWKQIREQKLFTKRIQLTLDILAKTSWRISYEK